jgi:hypothetical protein
MTRVGAGIGRRVGSLQHQPPTKATGRQAGVGGALRAAPLREKPRCPERPATDYDRPDQRQDDPRDDLIPGHGRSLPSTPCPERCRINQRRSKRASPQPDHRHATGRSPPEPQNPPQQWPERDCSRGAGLRGFALSSRSMPCKISRRIAAERDQSRSGGRGAASRSSSEWVSRGKCGPTRRQPPVIVIPIRGCRWRAGTGRAGCRRRLLFECGTEIIVRRASHLQPQI